MHLGQGIHGESQRRELVLCALGEFQYHEEAPGDDAGFVYRKHGGRRHPENGEC